MQKGHQGLGNDMAAGLVASTGEGLHQLDHEWGFVLERRRQSSAVQKSLAHLQERGVLLRPTAVDLKV
jgi:hypothetical protein